MGYLILAWNYSIWISNASDWYRSFVRLVQIIRPIGVGYSTLLLLVVYYYSADRKLDFHFCCGAIGGVYYQMVMLIVDYNYIVYDLELPDGYADCGLRDYNFL